ncbi:hypothetical protein [Streptomyces sp. NPDC057582]
MSSTDVVLGTYRVCLARSFAARYACRKASASVQSMPSVRH